MMKSRVQSALLLCLSMALSACAKDTPPSTATGWAIGWSNDAAFVPAAKILKTSDGGATWTLQGLPVACATFYGNDVSAVSAEVAWAAVGDRTFTDGGILHTADGGTTWTLQDLPAGIANRHIKNIKGVSLSEAWAVSYQGDVLHTSDGGAHWTLIPLRQADGTVFSFQAVNRMDVVGQDLWIVGGQGVGQVIHSPDAGATWQQAQLPNVERSERSLTITAPAPGVAWAAVNQGGNLWGTTDGGASWSKSTDSIGATSDYDDLCATSVSVVWIAMNRGPSGLVARLTVADGRFTSNQFSVPHYTMEGISAMGDGQTAWAVGQKPFGDTADLPQGVILATSDGGLTWPQQTLPGGALDVQLWKISFVGARR